MVRIESNIREVIGRLEQLQAGLDGAVQLAVAPEYWRPRLESVALKTIRAQWSRERDVEKREFYEVITPKVMETMSAELLAGGGSWFGLRIPEEAEGRAGPLLEAAGFNLRAKTPTGRTKKEVIEQGIWEPEKVDRAQIENLEGMRQMVRDWVELEKRWDAEDAELGLDEVTERVLFILGLSRRAVPRARTPVMEDAAASLAGAIERWLAGEGESPPPAQRAATIGSGQEMSRMGLSAAVAKEWLVAVLEAWKVFLLASLPGKLQFEIGKVLKVKG